MPIKLLILFALMARILTGGILHLLGTGEPAWDEATHVTTAACTKPDSGVVGRCVEPGAAPVSGRAESCVEPVEPCDGAKLTSASESIGGKAAPRAELVRGRAESCVEPVNGPAGRGDGASPANAGAPVWVSYSEIVSGSTAL